VTIISAPWCTFWPSLACRFVPASGGAHGPDTLAEVGRTWRTRHNPWQKPRCRCPTGSARFCEFWGVLSPKSAKPPEFPTGIGGFASNIDPCVDLWPAQIANSSRRSDARPDPSRACLYAPLLPRVGRQKVMSWRIGRKRKPRVYYNGSPEESPITGSTH
jgi:hypothetical protein